jgi:hypothetical protein
VTVRGGADGLSKTFSCIIDDKIMRSGFSIAHLLLVLNQKNGRLSLRLDARLFR